MILGLPNLVHLKSREGRSHVSPTVIDKDLMVFREGCLHWGVWKVPEEAEPCSDGLWKWSVTSPGDDRGLGCVRQGSPAQ